MPAAASTRPCRPRLLTLTTIAAAVLVGTVVLATFGPGVADAWPAPRYECYCGQCYDGYFVCRNRDYSCNCATCSCYDDDLVTAVEKPPRDKHGTTATTIGPE